MNESTHATMNLLRHTAIMLVTVGLAILSGCAGKEVPSDVMDEAKMASLLQDVYLLEGYYAVETGFQYDTLHPEMIASYDTLLSTYGISREYFEHSMEWYSRHPEIFQRVHDTILARFDREIAATPTQAQPIANEIKVTPSPFN